MKKLVINTICIIGLIVMFDLSGLAQNYQTSAGLRFGGNSGFTLKHFIQSDRAVEGIVSWWLFEGSYGDIWRLTGLYELHKQFTGVDNLYWLYGLGLHMGFGDTEELYWNPYWIEWRRRNRNFIAFGVDAVLGLEYILSDIPFTFGFDIHPFLEVNTLGAFPSPVDVAVSIRYIF